MDLRAFRLRGEIIWGINRELIRQAFRGCQRALLFAFMTRNEWDHEVRDSMPGKRDLIFSQKKKDTQCLCLTLRSSSFSDLSLDGYGLGLLEGRV